MVDPETNTAVGIVGSQALFVGGNDLTSRAPRLQSALLDVDRGGAKLANAVHVVADEHHRAAAAADVVHLAQALLLERGVADGEHLVDEQDLRLEVRGDREGQAHVHAARVVLDRRVEELLDLGERDDLVELALDLGPPHAEDGAVQVDVLAAGELGMEAGARLRAATRRGRAAPRRPRSAP